MQILRIMIASLVLAAVAGCKVEDEGDLESAIIQKTEILLSITAGEDELPLETVLFGEPVKFVLELRNLADNPVAFHFTSGQKFNFEVYDKSGSLVWNWVQGKMFTRSLETLFLDGNDQIIFSTLWNQKNNEGIQLPVGKYFVIGMITGTGPEQLESQKLTFTITSKQ